jgi:hypothetical protein
MGSTTSESPEFDDEYAWRTFDDRMVDSDFDKTKPFIPSGALDNAIKIDFILAVMDVQQSDKQINSLVEYILKNAKRLFSILTYIGLGQKDLQTAMELFKDAAFDDDKLPIGRTQSSSPAPNALVPNPTFTADAVRSVLTMVHQPKKTKIWRKMKRTRDFFDSQWMFLASTFSTNEPFRLMNLFD